MENKETNEMTTNTSVTDETNSNISVTDETNSNTSVEDETNSNTSVEDETNSNTSVKDETNTNTSVGDEKNTKTVDEVLKIFKNGWNKQVILYGPPGTSKTYSATEIAAKFLASFETKPRNLENHAQCEKYLENKTDQYKVIQFHPSYSYEDFVRGIVVKTKDENEQSLNIPTYEVERKIIETFGEGATKDRPRVLVIDEINRAPLGSVLGELIYGLEYRGKAVSTPYVYYEKEKKNEENSTKEKNERNSRELPLTISEHLYIIGTMNTADRSIGTMDYAVRRRFAFVPVLPCPEVIESTWNSPEVGEKAARLFKQLMGIVDENGNKCKEDENGIFAKGLLEDTELDVNDIKIGHTYFLGRKEETDESAYLRYRIDYQIRPVYQEYIKDGLIKKDGLKKFDMIVNQVMSKSTTKQN